VNGSKRYVTIAEYQRISGLSYPTIKSALERGELKGIRTESGHWKIDTVADTNPETAAILERLDKTEKMLTALCKQFNTVIT